MSGRCFSASSSHHVTCAMMSRTDHLPVTLGISNCDSDRPAYDSSNAAHAESSRFSTCCEFMFVSTPSGGRLLCVVKDHAEGVATPGAHSAHPVTQVDAVVAARPLHRAMAHSEDHPVALAQRHHLRSRLHARPLLHQHELAP